MQAELPMLTAFKVLDRYTRKHDIVCASRKRGIQWFRENKKNGKNISENICDWIELLPRTDAFLTELCFFCHYLARKKYFTIDDQDTMELFLLEIQFRDLDVALNRDKLQPAAQWIIDAFLTSEKQKALERNRLEEAAIYATDIFAAGAMASMNVLMKFMSYN